VLIESDWKEKLAKEAVRARENAYAVYSRFKVGAAVLTDDGRVFTGCNIEISSYGLTVCAERVALFKAYSEGYRDIKAIAVAGETQQPISPCGACRQVLLELAPRAEVILLNKDMSQILMYNVEDLLPYAFKL